MKTITLQVLEGIDKGRVFRDLPVPVTIGREEGNVLRLNDERVSRYHAKVQLDNEDVIITDLDSTNGTRVNGSPVQIRRLRPGDQIALGRSTLLFGSHTEIALRKVNMRAVTDHAALPVDKTIGDPASPEPRSDQGREDNSPQDAPPEWQPRDRDLPPLPQKLTPAQAARIAEILDYLHRGLASAAENVDANDDGTVVRLSFNDWQKVQAVEMLLARYLRGVAEPDTMIE